MKLFAEDCQKQIEELEKQLKWERDKSATLDRELHWKNMENEDHHAQIERMTQFLEEFNQQMRDLKYEKEDLEVVVKKRDNTIKYRD